MSPIRHIVPERLVDPRCRGFCKGDRPANDPPAKLGHRPDGTQVAWCPCCEAALREERFDFSSGPPNVTREVKGKQRRFSDDICGYNFVLVSEVTPR